MRTFMTARKGVRRRLLALGGIGAVLGLARGTQPVGAGHTSLNNPEPLHIGVLNDGGNPANDESASSINATTVLVANAVGPLLRLRNLSGIGLVANGGVGSGVHGKSGSGDGVRGESSTGSGVHGTSASNFTQGLLGEGTGNAHGVTGTSVNAFGLSGTSTNAKGCVGVNTSGNDFAGLFIGHGANPANNTAPGIFVKGRAVITGGVSASALTSQGPRLLHGIQAADELHEDVGTATLRAGRARVELDPLFAETIKADDYHVFLTPHSAESKGLANVGRDGRGFEVRELWNGTGSYAFDWRVVAERKGAPAGSRLMRALDPDLRGTLERLGAPPTARPADRSDPRDQDAPSVPAPPVPPPAPTNGPSRR